MPNNSQIIRNSALCLSCNTEIESKHRHDFVKCPCGNLMVDGGRDYLKRGAVDVTKVRETSLYQSNWKGAVDPELEKGIGEGDY